MNIKKKIILAGLLTAAASSAAFAAYYPSHHVEREYYSSASLSHVVGRTIQKCSGRFISHGEKTQYFVDEITFPCGGPVEE